MAQAFNKIGLMGRHRTAEATETFNAVIEYLKTKPVEIFLDEESSSPLNCDGLQVVAHSEIGKLVDLVIVVGGDGSLLQAARAIVDDGTPIIGVNRGRLGFLTDIKPQNIDWRIDEILSGKVLVEERFLIEASANGTTCAALNDITLATGDTAHMMEFEVYINDRFVCSERSDGMIIATPTGSTAYALSGGGPIVQPTLDALVLVPMFSHTLNSRPIVVPGDSKISIVIGERTVASPRVSGDGRSCFNLNTGDELHIHKKAQQLKLLHPKDYDYFESVRSKLHWGKKLQAN